MACDHRKEGRKERKKEERKEGREEDLFTQIDKQRNME